MENENGWKYLIKIINYLIFGQLIYTILTWISEDFGKKSSEIGDLVTKLEENELAA